jgi:hypothetical protein
MLRCFIVFATIAALVSVPMAGAAQDATPIAGGMTFGPQPLVPDPSECRIEPRPRAFFDPFFGTPIAGIPESASPESTQPTPTVGMPTPGLALVDDATVEAVIATLREWIACLNAQDIPRLYALTTERSVREALMGMSPVELAEVFAPKSPVPESDRLGLSRVDGIYLTKEGNIAVLRAEFVVRGRIVEDHFLRFTFEDGRYLLDI